MTRTRKITRPVEATTTSRAIAALVEIMGAKEAPRRRIEAAEHLLDYECS
jgi:hypothetical protein